MKIFKPYREYLNENSKNGPMDKVLFELIPADIVREIKAFICP